MNDDHPSPTRSNRARQKKDELVVVGIGASAGGLAALSTFLDHLPADTGMAHVVILHLSPKHESNADKVLQRSTRMPVRQVTEPTLIEPNTVYVISPNNHLSMSDGYLRVEAAQRPFGAHVAIDLFFRALAEVHREHAIGIVLSGTGSDGSVGLARVREQGGVTIATKFWPDSTVPYQIAPDLPASNRVLAAIEAGADTPFGPKLRRRSGRARARRRPSNSKKRCRPWWQRTGGGGRTWSPSHCLFRPWWER